MVSSVPLGSAGFGFSQEARVRMRKRSDIVFSMRDLPWLKHFHPGNECAEWGYFDIQS
jgi:hypothetical protein